MTITAATGIWSVGASWPWPQIVQTDYFTLGFAIKADGKLALYELVNTVGTWIATEKIALGTASGITKVNVAGFDKYYIITVEDYITGTVDYSIYWRHPSTGVVTEFGVTDMPAGASCCNYLGQVIIGGLFSSQAPWSTLGQCSVAWSDIGSAEMNPENYVVAGFAKMPWDDNGTGKVWKVLPVGNDIMVYGDKGIAKLKPFTVERTTGFGILPVKSPGLIGSDAIDGDELIHGYVDNKYEWHLISNARSANLGYKKYLKTLTNGQVVVRYNKHRQQFYISDGVVSFVYTKGGMYSTNQCLTSTGVYKGTLCGFVKDNGDAKIRVASTPFNFDHQSLKTLESVEVGASYETTADELLYGAISIKYDYKGGFTQLPWTQLNERGIFTQKATGREFKVHLQANYESGAEFSLSSFLTKLKFSDKRNIRGRVNAS